MMFSGFPAVQIVGFPKDKNYLYKTHVDNEIIDLLIRDIKDYESQLLNGSWVSRPCYFKSYGTSNIECEYCKIANKIFGDN